MIILDPKCNVQDFLERVKSSGHKEIILLRKPFFRHVLPKLKANGKMEEISTFIRCEDEDIQNRAARELQNAINDMTFETCESESLFKVIDRLMKYVEDEIDNSEDDVRALEIHFAMLADLIVALLLYVHVNSSQSKLIHSHLKQTEETTKKMIEKKRKSQSPILNNFHCFVDNCLETKNTKCSFKLFKKWGESRIHDKDVKAYIKHVSNASTAELYIVVMALVFKVRC